MTPLDLVTVVWQQNGTAKALARVCADDATGAATGVSGEGNWVKQADLSGITCKVFDRSSKTTPDTPIATPTVTPASSIIDTPVTDGKIWDLDTVGYNFTFTLASGNFPSAGHKYLVEFTFTTTGGSIWTLSYEGMASPVL